MCGKFQARIKVERLVQWAPGPSSASIFMRSWTTLFHLYPALFPHPPMGYFQANPGHYIISFINISVFSLKDDSLKNITCHFYIINKTNEGIFNTTQTIQVCLPLSLFLNPHPRIFFIIDFRGGRKEREALMCDRNINWLPPVYVLTGIEPAT